MATAMSARWTFTFNNPPPGFELSIDDDVDYLVYQIERGSTTHVQGYLRFKSRKRFTTALNWLHGKGMDGVHIEAAKGTEEDNKNYCTKNDTRIEGPFEFGNYKGDSGKQGKRSDLEKIAKDLQEGRELKEIAIEHPADFIRYHGGIQAMQLLIAPQPSLTREISTVILWGNTGTGKTHRIMHSYPNIYSVKPGRDPWGSYRGEKEILFDEYDYEKWSLQEMNRFCDKWRCLLDARYRDRYAEWNKVFILANSNPRSWWPMATQMLLDAFYRRLTGIWLVNSQEPTLDQIMSGPQSL